MLLCRGALVLLILCPKPEMAKVAICFSLLQNCSFCDIMQSRQPRNFVNITLYYAEELFGGADSPNPQFPFVPRTWMTLAMVRQWWVESALGCHCLSLPPWLTTRVPLDWGSLIVTKPIHWQMRLICFLCTVDWKHTDADWSCLFAQSCWLNLANSACEPAWSGRDGASHYGGSAVWVHGVCCCVKTRRN